MADGDWPEWLENDAEIPGDPRYEILGELGRGAVGAVYQARDRVLDRVVAVKILRARFRDNLVAIQAFEQEARLCSQLAHPNVVAVYDLGLLGGQIPFFAMKQVAGQTLAQHLHHRKRPGDNLAFFLQVFEQVCQAVAFAHSRGVIHRDLKPSNVMVGEFGEVQVMDWGMAAVADEVLSQSNSAIIREAADKESGIGTWAYMPPEQALPNTLPDFRSDVFGLGGILCEILTGKPVYVGSTREDVQALAIKADLNPAYSRLDGTFLDRDLIRLARACLAKEPRDRPASAMTVAHVITAYREQVAERLRTAESKCELALTQIQAERERSRGLVYRLIALLVVTCALTGYAWVGYERSSTRAEAARSIQSLREQADSIRRQAKNMATGQDASSLQQALGLWDRYLDQLNHAKQLADLHGVADNEDEKAISQLLLEGKRERETVLRQLNTLRSR